MVENGVRYVQIWSKIRSLVEHFDRVFFSTKVE